MMDFLKRLWSYAPMLVMVALVVAVAWVAIRYARGRKHPPARPLVPATALDDPESLDSSHIGGPIFESTIDPNFSGKGRGH